jgi:hypothetical protein
MPNLTTVNLVQGPADIYTGVWTAGVGPVEPADGSLNTTPAVSAWTPAGATSGGVAMNVNLTYSFLDVDQIPEHADARLTGRVVEVVFSLAEATLENLKLSLNGGTITGVTPGKSFEPDVTALGGPPNYTAILFDGFADGGTRRRAIVRKTLQTAALKLEQKKDGQTMYACTYTSFFVSSSIKPFRIVQ